MERSAGRRILGSSVAALAFVAAFAPAALAMSLPAPGPINTGPNYGQFYSYPLHLLNYLGGYGEHSNPGDPFYVAAAKGQIEGTNLILLQHPRGDNSPPLFSSQVDDSFVSPSGGGPFSFSTRTQGEPPEGTPVGDTNFSWDVNLSALKGYLGGNDLVYLYSNNQAGAGLSQDLYAWGVVILHSTTNSSLGDICFYFNMNLGGSLSGQAPCSANETTGAGTPTFGSNVTNSNGEVLGKGDFIRAFGDLCLDSAGEAVACGSATQALPTIAQNLGTNDADYALFSPELNNLDHWIALGYDVARHWFQMENMTDGDDTLFICNNCTVERTVPQPGTIILLGAAMALLAIVGRRLNLRRQ